MRVQMHLRLDEEIHASVKDEADKQGESMTFVINSILKDYFSEKRYKIIVIEGETEDGRWYEFHIPEGLAKPHDGEGVADG